MVGALPLRGSEGGQPPVVGIEQLALDMARAMGQLITRQWMELPLGQVEVGPSASVHDAQDQHTRAHLGQSFPVLCRTWRRLLSFAHTSLALAGVRCPSQNSKKTIGASDAVFSES